MTSAPEDEPRPGFYAGALNDHDRELLEQARLVEGLDEEIAMMRVNFRKRFASNPEPGALARDAEALTRAVALRYRISPQYRDEFADHITQTLRSVTEQVAPWLIEGKEDV